MAKFARQLWLESLRSVACVLHRISQRESFTSKHRTSILRTLNALRQDGLLFANKCGCAFEYDLTEDGRVLLDKLSLRTEARERFDEIILSIMAPAEMTPPPTSPTEQEDKDLEALEQTLAKQDRIPTPSEQEIYDEYYDGKSGRLKDALLNALNSTKELWLHTVITNKDKAFLLIVMMSDQVDLKERFPCLKSDDILLETFKKNGREDL